MKLLDDGSAAVQVFFAARDGSVRVFLYNLIAEEGGWKIGGLEELNRYWPRQPLAGMHV